ncbi:uncharacterized protein [Amphiura filiformis]|uniref:uncharacterized protein n=1 Tax=Amphiura filiformis TaxID=82378 RepID=UPI003B213298
MQIKMPAKAMRLGQRYAMLSIITASLFLFTKLITTGTPQSQTIRRDVIADKPPTRVFLWAVPRSVSTTLLISLSQSPDVEAWFEPYLFASQMEHFRLSGESVSLQWGLKMTLASLSVTHGYDMRDVSFTWVKQQLENYNGDKNVIVKDMVKGIAGKFNNIPNGYTHTFLIRHPLRVFASYKQKHNTEGGMNKGLKLTEFSSCWIPSGYFFKEMYDLVHHIRDVLKLKVIIIDSDDLLENPEEMIKAYCKETGLTYSDTMLNWEPNNDIWWNWMLPKETSLKWWWRSVYYGYNPTHKTSFSQSGFGEKMDLPDHVDDDVRELAQASMKYYNELFTQRLQVASYESH